MPADIQTVLAELSIVYSHPEPPLHAFFWDSNAFMEQTDQFSEISEQPHNFKHDKHASFFDGNPFHRTNEWLPIEVPRVSLCNHVKGKLLLGGGRAYRTINTLRVGERPNEHIRVNFLGHWLWPLLDCFNYRIRLTSEPSSGGVEHELAMGENIIMYVIEIDLDTLSGPTYWTRLGQVMAKLEYAYKTNLWHDVGGSAVYAVFTNFKAWEFLAYNGTRREFYRDESIIASPEFTGKFVDYIMSMIPVSSRMYGILLQGFIDALEAYGKKTAAREQFEYQPKYPPPFPLQIPSLEREDMSIDGPSAQVWRQAKIDAQTSQQMASKSFQLFKNGEVLQGRNTATEAMEKLTTCSRTVASYDENEPVRIAIDDLLEELRG